MIYLLFLLVFLFVIQVLFLLIPGNKIPTQFILSTIFVMLVQKQVQYLNSDTQFKQFMQMYLLIPVSQNIKFLTKLCVALVIYTILFLLTCSISLSLAYFVTGKPISIISLGITGHDLYIFTEIFVLASSVATFTSIVVKKYASLLFLITSVILFLGTFISYRLLGLCSSFESFYELFIIQLQSISVVAVAFLSIIFYGLSYHFFLRRQL